MANTYLTRTTSTPTNADKITFSAWIKKSKVSGNMSLIADYGSSTNRGKLQFSSADKLEYYQVDGGSATSQLRTNRLFRDVNAWYHILFQYDSSQSTASDRLKFYINGIQETSFEIATYPSQNQDSRLNKSGVTLNIGQEGDNGNYFNGLMSHVHFIDGTAYAPTEFGSTDSTTAEWKINTSPSVSYGTNGFFILKDGNTITDQSSNSNDFTLGGGTLTKTEDNPSNVFATINPLFGAGGEFGTMSNGNTTSYTSNLGVAGTSTLGASSGKYYAEFKHSACTSGGADEGAIGVCDTYFISSNSNLGGSSSPGYQEYSLGNWGLRNTNGRFFYSSGGSKYTADNQHAGWSLGDIIMLGLDCDNNRLYFGKNGVWSSSNTWSSSTPSQYITIDPTNFEGNYHFACGDSSGTNVSTWQCNFGNGYFGTTAVSSAGTNASGIGIFEYDVPTGYTALSTKGLNL